MPNGSAGVYNRGATFAGEPPLAPLAAIQRREWFICLAVSFSLLAASAIISAKKPLWFDEVISLTLASDRSVSHMLRALAHGADGMPPLYYIVAQAWRRIFGNSVTAMRLLSPAALSLGVFAAFGTLRRGFSVSAAGPAVALAFCTPWIIAFQSSDLRPYGMFMGIAGVALWLHPRLASAENISPALFGGAALCHAALVLCHPYGILYSAAFLVALGAWQVWSKQVRLAALAAIACGASAVLLWLAPFLRISAMSRPRSPTMAPAAKDLAASYAFGMHDVLPVLTMVLLLARLAELKKRPSTHAAERKFLLAGAALFLASCLLSLRSTAVSPVAAPLLLAAVAFLAVKPAGADRLPRAVQPLFPLAAALLLVPVAAFLISQVLTPAFQIRYLLPSWYGVMILIAGAIENAHVPAVRDRRWLHAALWAVMVPVIIVLPVIRAYRVSLGDAPLFGSSRKAIEALAPPRRAIVVEEPLAFLPLAHVGQSSSNQYYFALDRNAALATAAAHPIINFNLMQVWADYGYLDGHIVPPEAFLAGNSSFLVLHSPGYSWFGSCCANNPAYTTRKLGRVGNSVLMEVSKAPGHAR